jgi:hypothetical protein
MMKNLRQGKILTTIHKSKFPGSNRLKGFNLEYDSDLFYEQDREIKILNSLKYFRGKGGWRYDS